ncbi:hypothetical protein MUK72_12425 [Halococcus dombrowskii]|uniref:DUF998 domain-containing protein n=1 Tax=Halococcus dombrowskii TaxID=179637 RepID=A0AAV3SFX2_HALDO|nr:hypothetical protein [Halococcus dombrowskii]UOO94765.1 hypothetical protein MUK72_12425 [Halococcus dombrowskii]
MDGSRVAPLVGIIGCGLVLLALLAPYLGADAGAIGIYYGDGVVNPLVGGLFAAVTVIVLAAGRSGRTAPATAAGVALVFGLVIAGVSLVWSLTVPESTVFQLSTTSLIEFHRWLLALVSLVVPASGAWYARALALV